MLLIADSGSTKTDWVLVDENKKRSCYKTIGYNPYFVDCDTIYYSLIDKLVTQFDPEAVRKIIFYGAGCSNETNVDVVKQALEKCFINARVFVEHDMLASAHALLVDKPGFAAILGTGSNACIYNGKTITKSINSLGYLLGDEGSGSNIGKKILRDLMRDNFPADLKKKFNGHYRLSQSQIFDALYNQPLPNSFLAGFCKFADDNKDHQYIKDLVKESFNEFFKNMVICHAGYQNLSFNCVGSVGFIFKNELKDVAEFYNMKVGRLLPSPIDELVNYHLDLNQAKK